MTDRIATLRAFFARYVCTKGGTGDGTGDPRIEEAFAAVPREVFAGPGPWWVSALGFWAPREPGSSYVRTPNADPAFLYQDTLIALDHTRGINIGEPSLHARCLGQLAVQRGDTVLHVGAGSGYYSALLAHLAGAKGRVHAFEIDAGLAERAQRNLAYLSHVEVHARSGIADDLPEADCIYVNAGITDPSRGWLRALRPGGRLLFPLQPVSGLGGMLLVEKGDGHAAWPARFVSRAVFIGCVTRQDEATGAGLRAAFARGDADAVRSLRLGGEPDDTCWCAGENWWLSSVPADVGAPPAAEP